MPGRTRFDDFNCSLARTLDVVGDWWTLLIVRDAAMGVGRFGGFEASLGIAKNILSDRLGRLVAAGLMVRGADGGYALTAKGRGLVPALVALMQWGDRWVFDGAGPVVVTDADGRVVDGVVLTAGGRAVDVAGVRFGAGVGADERTRKFVGGGG